MFHSNQDRFKTSEAWVKRLEIASLRQLVYSHEDELLAMIVQSEEVEMLKRMWLGVVGHLPGFTYEKSR